MMKKGYFISFEGIDGSGKSTHIKKLKDFLENRGYEVVLTREPGGTEIGEQIRRIILDKEHTDMTYMTEAFLYAASRAQHVHEVIKPALEAGKIVICDRFIDSSIAYQGYGRELGESVDIINRYAVEEYVPDITFLMKVDTDVSSHRIDGREKDRIELETEEFYHRVSAGYEELENRFPDRIVSIDASGSIDATEKSITGHMLRLMEKRRAAGAAE